MMMKTGIIFDLDGTLLDTLDDLMDSMNAMLRKFGYPERTREEIRRFVGNGAENLVYRAVPEGCTNAAEVYAAFRPYYKAHNQIKTCAYPGIPEALGKIAAKFPVAIVSNKPDESVKILCNDYFPGIYARGESAECARKPAPDMVYAAMKYLDVEKAIYVGDSEVDVVTAKNAGIPCVSVLWGFRDREEMIAAGADIFCESVEMLPEIIDGVEENNG